MKIYVASSWRNEARQQECVRRLRAEGHEDMGALERCDACVLVLPCGRSAHLELGWATGALRHTVVWLDSPLSEPELMYKACNALCVTLDEVVAELGGAG